MNRGLFVTFEGGEGVGKTSVITALEKLLTNVSLVVTREPGGVSIAEQIREVILDCQNSNMDGLVEAFLYASSRRQHLVEKVIPALNDGKVVLCDRYIDSSIVYQGYARGLGMEKVRKINDLAIDGLMPDITFFFDISPKEAFKRLESREMNRLDLESQTFHEKVYEGYQKIINDDRFIVIDARLPFEEVVDEVYQNLMKKLGNICE